MSLFEPGIVDYLALNYRTSSKNIRAYLHWAPRRYKQYFIPKKSGTGKRKIAQPTRALKLMQRAVVKEYLSDLPVHECAHAYVRGKGIRANAAEHVANSYLLKMDFVDFFPSIKPADLVVHVEKNIGILSEDEKFVLENLFFFSPSKFASPRLSIGAPSSPFISNTIMFDFDRQLYEICAAHNISYTRYADDLTFSTNEKDILYSFPKTVSEIRKEIEYPSYKINHKKTVFASTAKNRRVTGLVLSNEGKISLGRKRKRYLKSLVFKFRENQLEYDDLQYLRGMIAFSMDVDPDFVESLKEKYGEAPVRELLGENISKES